jgi:hypothetical protein
VKFTYFIYFFCFYPLNQYIILNYIGKIPEHLSWHVHFYLYLILLKIDQGLFHNNQINNKLTNQIIYIKMEDDGYFDELFRLFRQSQTVSAPNGTLGPYKRFEKDY